MLRSTKIKIIIAVIVLIVIGLAVGLSIYFVQKSKSSSGSGSGSEVITNPNSVSSIVTVPSPVPIPADIQGSIPAAIPEKTVAPYVPVLPSNYKGFPLQTVIQFQTIKADLNDNKPNITSNVINNIDLSWLRQLAYRKNVGYSVQIFQNAGLYNHNYYVTEVDFKTNSITFNAPSDFKLDGTRAWPFDLNQSAFIPYPTMLNLPPRTTEITYQSYS